MSRKVVLQNCFNPSDGNDASRIGDVDFRGGASDPNIMFASTERVRKLTVWGKHCPSHLALWGGKPDEKASLDRRT
jgi:hypothetical protein